MICPIFPNLFTLILSVMLGSPYNAYSSWLLFLNHIWSIFTPPKILRSNFLFKTSKRLVPLSLEFTPHLQILLLLVSLFYILNNWSHHYSIGSTLQNTPCTDQMCTSNIEARFQKAIKLLVLWYRLIICMRYVFLKKDDIQASTSYFV